LSFGAHPEFGYFCVTPRLRRRLRIFLALGVLGLVAIGSVSGLFTPSQEPPAREAYASVAPGDVPGGTITTVRGVFGTSASDSGSIFSIQSPANVEQGKSSCQDRQENTWKYLEGQCGLDKPRKMRKVHVATERPPIAAVAIGHSRTSSRTPPAAQSPAAAPVGVPAILAARPSVTVDAPAPAVAAFPAAAPPQAVASAPPAVPHSTPAAAPDAAPAAAAPAASASAPASAVKKPAANPAPVRVVARREDARREDAPVRRSSEASGRRNEESFARHSYTSPYAAPIYHYGSASQHRPGWSLF
jgi:hypothetical protein